jgi:formylmethanofuran dehydrogenase subunit E
VGHCERSAAIAVLDRSARDTGKTAQLKPRSRETVICSHTFEEYLEIVESFHGHVAPGMILGGFMVDLARRHIPQGTLADALSETPKCLPDAIQLLTPCTVGNGWLRILNLGRFAMAFYDKRNGEGVRVFADLPKMEPWPEIRDWFLKRKPKEAQDRTLLLQQIREAGSAVCGVRTVRLRDDVIRVRRRGPLSVCRECGESYPMDDGATCLGCQGKAPYVAPGSS